jgi:hypothetical protein
MELSDFVIERVFHHIPAKYDENDELVYDEVYWREVKGGDEGYIIVWSNGVHDHTYSYPPNIWA